MKHTIRFVVNGVMREVIADSHRTLLEVLRDELGLTGVKYGCGTGECGACTILLDERPVLSCLTLALYANHKTVVTIEGLAEGTKLDPLQKSFVDHSAIQCGYCTPGFIICAKSLLKEIPEPSEDEIRRYLRGNLCRCTGYVKILEAVMAASSLKEARP